MIGTRVQMRDKPERKGTVKVVLSLDWPEVEWDDEPGKIDMIHSSKIQTAKEEA